MHTKCPPATYGCSPSTPAHSRETQARSPATLGRSVSSCKISPEKTVSPAAPQFASSRLHEGNRAALIYLKACFTRHVEVDCLLEDKLHKDAGGFLNSEEVAMVIRQPDSSRKMEKIVSMLLSKGDDEFDAFNDWIFFYCKDLIWLHPRYGWYFKVEQHQPPGRPTPPAGQARAQQPTRPPAADSRNSLDPAPRLSSVGAPAGHKQASLEQVGQLKAKL